MQNHFRLASFIADFLENRFRILGVKFGFDPIIGLVPGIGDIISTLLSLYIVWIGTQMKLPKHAVNKMLRNILIDFIIGVFPVIGDLGDVLYRANTKNIEIIKQYKPEAVIEGEFK